MTNSNIASIWNLYHSLIIDLSYISLSWRLFQSVIFEFVIHFVKLKAMPFCYIWICHSFRQAEGYDTLLYSNLSYISSSWRLCHSAIFEFVIPFVNLKAIPLSYNWFVIHFVNLKAMPLCYIWFVIHFVKLKAMTLCYIQICHTFRQAEGYATLRYLNLSFIEWSMTKLSLVVWQYLVFNLSTNWQFCKEECCATMIYLVFECLWMYGLPIWYL
jgi:hypothetical protein